MSEEMAQSEIPRYSGESALRMQLIIAKRQSMRATFEAMRRGPGAKPIGDAIVQAGVEAWYAARTAVAYLGAIAHGEVNVRGQSE